MRTVPPADLALIALEVQSVSRLLLEHAAAGDTPLSFFPGAADSREGRSKSRLVCLDSTSVLLSACKRLLSDIESPDMARLMELLSMDLYRSVEYPELPACLINLDVKQSLCAWASEVSRNVSVRARPVVDAHCNMHPESLDDLSRVADAYVSRDSTGDNVRACDIGFGNTYDLLAFADLQQADSFPMNTLVYVDSIKQVVIKIGKASAYRLVNSRLSRVHVASGGGHPPAIASGHGTSRPQAGQSSDRPYAASLHASKPMQGVYRSVICNNNLRQKKKRCAVAHCNYYHDPILGYLDNMHSSRQYPPNPQVPRCPTFRSGDVVSENVSSTQWHDAITLYQASLHNLLIAAVHSSIGYNG